MKRYNSGPPEAAPSDLEGLVVTDLKGSTQLWSHFEGLMPTLLGIHDSVMRRVLAKHGGRELLTEGDSFQVVFRDASTAMAFCVEAQRELLVQDWPEEILKDPCCSSVVVNLDDVEARVKSSEFWKDVMMAGQGRPLLFRGSDRSGSDRTTEGSAGSDRLAMSTGGPRRPSHNVSRFFRETVAPATTATRPSVELPAVRTAKKRRNSRIAGGTAADSSHRHSTDINGDGSPKSSDLQVEGSGRSVTEILMGFFRGKSNARRTSATINEAWTSEPSGAASIFFGPRVRMGVHVVPRGLEPGSEEALGYLSLAKAIADAADGGQILASGAAWDLIDLNIVERLVGENVRPLHMGRHAVLRVRFSNKGASKHPPLSGANSSSSSPRAGALLQEITSGRADSSANVNVALSSEQELYSALPDSLLARFLHFSAPATPKRLTPSFPEAPLGEVTIAFSYLCEMSELQAGVPPAAFSEVIKLHDQALRTQLAEYAGYECRRGLGYFLMAFASPAAAVRFALSVQDALMRVQWPEEARGLASFSKVTMNGVLLFNGPRLQIGMSTGVPGSVSPSDTTGRADYFGNVANIAARIASVAAGGQSLITSMCWEAARLELFAEASGGGSNLEAIDLGRYKLKGVDEPVQIMQVHNQRLRMRPFQPLKDSVKVTRVAEPTQGGAKLRSRRRTVDTVGGAPLGVQMAEGTKGDEEGPVARVKSSTTLREKSSRKTDPQDSLLVAGSMRGGSSVTDRVVASLGSAEAALPDVRRYLTTLVIHEPPSEGPSGSSIKGQAEAQRLWEAANAALQGVSNSSVLRTRDPEEALDLILDRPGCLLFVHHSAVDPPPTSPPSSAASLKAPASASRRPPAAPILRLVRELVPFQAQPIVVSFGGPSRPHTSGVDRHVASNDLRKEALEVLLRNTEEEVEALYREAVVSYRSRVSRPGFSIKGSRVQSQAPGPVGAIKSFKVAEPRRLAPGPGQPGRASQGVQSLQLSNGDSQRGSGPTSPVTVLQQLAPMNPLEAAESDSSYSIPICPPTMDLTIEGSSGPGPGQGAASSASGELGGSRQSTGRVTSDSGAFQAPSGFRQSSRVMSSEQLYDRARKGSSAAGPTDVSTPASLGRGAIGAGASTPPPNMNGIASPGSTVGSARSVGMSTPFVRKQGWMVEALATSPARRKQQKEEGGAGGQDQHTPLRGGSLQLASPSPLESPPPEDLGPHFIPAASIPCPPGVAPVPDVVAIRRGLLGLDPAQQRAQATSMMDLLGMIEGMELGQQGSSRFAVLVSAIFTVLQYVAEAVQVCSSDGRIEFANAAWETMTGFKLNEVQDENPLDLLGLLDSNVPEVITALIAAIDSGATWRGKVLASRRNGSVFLTEVQVLCIKGTEGSVEYVVWIIRDLSVQALSGEGEIM